MHRRISSPVDLFRLTEINVVLTQAVQGCPGILFHLPTQMEQNSKGLRMRVGSKMSTVGHSETTPSGFQNLLHQEVPTTLTSTKD